MDVVKQIREFLFGMINEPYFWVAELKTGEVLSQFVPYGNRMIQAKFQIALDEEKKDNLKAIYWVNTFTGNHIGCELGNGRRAILFIRKTAKLVGGKTEVIKKIYAVGWQKTVNEKNVKSIMFIYPDGSIRMGDEV